MTYLILPLVVVTLPILLVAGFRMRTRLRHARGSDLAGNGRGATTRFLLPYRGVLSVGVALTLVESALDLASPWPLKVVVDNAIGGHPLPPWLTLFQRLSPTALTALAAAAGISLVALSGLIGYLTNYVMGAASERIGADMRTAAFARLQHLSMRFHDRNRTGDLVTRLSSDVGRVEDSLLAWFETVIPQAVTLVGMLVVMFVIDVQLAWAALAVVPGLVWFVMWMRPRVKAAQREARARSGALASMATEVLRNVRAVQVFSRHREEEERFRESSDAAASAAIDALDVSARYSPVADLVLAAGTGLILWLGVIRIASGAMTLGALLVVLAYLSSLYGPIRSLSRLTSTLAKGAVSRERLSEIFGEDELVRDGSSGAILPAGPLPLSMDGVSFAYRPGTPVLRDVSFQVAPEERVCIVGSTGAGKSTLLSLILRLYDPDAGEIRMGTADVRSLALSSLRERAALVPQETWMLDGTVADNIAFGRSGATREDVLRAARLAFVDEFAERLPDGYDTVVGEGGSLLSGGQRRRIALARALLRNASLLLLDEPTSGLDAASEATVMRALNEASEGRTVVMVSHRLGIAATADRVIVLTRGRVVEEGSPDRLLEQDGPYARLWSAQKAATPIPISRGRPLAATSSRSGERR